MKTNNEIDFKWRIYYGDGSTYDSRDGSVWDAPSANVQVVVNADMDTGWNAERACDYYWYDLDLAYWQAGDIFGLWDYLSRPGQKKVIFGRLIPLAEYQATLRKAMSDPELPKKAAWRQGELPEGGL